ncbi:hypothetical protein [Caproiciproducens sp. CPB-2]|uniref:hypothetical protein n=1 Tax=Caproiciproducens sp. CPB-2 TaxID=3030017 RepID=UPI0023DCE7D2|nr:hypothetical protein [Caproiciproducens sp. CPB-2]MDF1496153.1 hypothetical protein [Caproiciproducens sp. CPB-2]
MKYHSSILEEEKWSIDIDLCADFNAILWHRLKNMGYTPSSAKHSATEYFKVKKLQIPQKKRQACYSKEFSCPPGYEAALSEFQSRVENGSDYELFVYFTDTTAYFLQVYRHQKKHLFASQDLVRILHDNWPELISNRKLNDVLSLYPHAPSDEEYDCLRKAHVLTMVEVKPGTVYFPLGGGYASDGSSTDAVRLSDHWHNLLKRIEIEMVSKPKELISAIKTICENDEQAADMSFKLIAVSGQELLLFEERNSIVMQFFLNTDRPARLCRPADLYPSDI